MDCPLLNDPVLHGFDRPLNDGLFNLLGRVHWCRCRFDRRSVGCHRRLLRDGLRLSRDRFG